MAYRLRPCSGNQVHTGELRQGNLTIDPACKWTWARIQGGCQGFAQHMTVNGNNMWREQPSVADTDDSL
jgi:hypothetical protein